MMFMGENKNSWIWIFVAVALFLLFGSFGMGGYGMTGLGMGFGQLFMLLFWGVSIWLVVALINASQSGEKEEESLSILKKRYASGEITKEQYEEMKRETK